MSEDEKMLMTPPQAANPPLPAHLLATPHNHGTASSAEYRQTLREDELVFPLSEDLQNHQRCDFKALLLAFIEMMVGTAAGDPAGEAEAQTIFDECLGVAVKFCNYQFGNPPSQRQERSRAKISKEVATALKEYCGAGGNETTRYGPLSRALNSILKAFRFKNETLGIRESLGNFTDILVHQNDPTVIQTEHSPGLKSSRKPDLVLACLDVINDIHARPGDKWDDCVGKLHSKAEGAPKLEFEDTLQSLEIKVNEKFFGPPRTVPYSTELPLPEGKYMTVPKMVRPSKEQDDKQSESSAPASGGATTPGSASARSQTRRSRPPLLAPRQNLRSQTAAPSAEWHKGQNSGDKRSRSASGDVGSSNKRSRIEDPEPNHHRKLHPTEQSALYAAERLMAKPSMTHVIGTIIQDQNLYLWWYDRQQCIQSSSLDFIADLPYLVVLLILFQRFKKEQWGIEPKFDSRFNIKVENRIFGQVPGSGDPEYRYSLIGRGTFTFAVKEENDVNKVEYFMKLSWPEERRSNEADVIAKAMEWSSTLKSPQMITDHIPTVIAKEDFTSTSTIRRRLKLIAEGDSTTGCRIQRAIVFRKLSPITDLKGDHFWDAFWEIVRCHALLWKVGIRHGDISVSNLMYDSTRQKGVLNDYDLAVIAPHGDIPSSHGHDRTGTMPFMALQLLTHAGWHGGIPRLYRHDLESFAWALAWICYCYEDGRQKIQKAFKPWITNHYKTCGYVKGGFLKNFEEGSSTEPVPSKDYAKFAKAAFWLVDFWVQFDLDRVRQGVRKKDAAEEQKATKDNAVSDTGAGAPTEWANVKGHADVEPVTPPWKQPTDKEAIAEVICVVAEYVRLPASAQGWAAEM